MGKPNCQKIILNYILFASLIAFLLFSTTSCSYNLAKHLRPDTSRAIQYTYSFIKSSDPFYQKLLKLYAKTDLNDTIRGRVAIVYRSLHLDNQIVYFAINEKKEDLRNPYIFSDHFLNSAFMFRHDSVFVAPILRKNDLNKLTNRQFYLLSSGCIKSADTLTVAISFFQQEMKIRLCDFKKEPLVINGRRWSHCLSFTTIEEWPYSSSYGKVWLAKGYGVVKWIRVTGRIEEIKL
jgi:hypothetical protein